MNDVKVERDAETGDTRPQVRAPAAPPKRNGARALLTLIAFAGLGPPAGAFAYTLGRAALGFALGEPIAFDAAFQDGRALAYPGSYYVGLVPAAVTGALVAGPVWLRGRAEWWLTALLALLASGAGAWYAARGLGPKLKPGDLPYLYGGFAAVSLAAATGCWWFASVFGIFRARG